MSARIDQLIRVRRAAQQALAVQTRHDAEAAEQVLEDLLEPQKNLILDAWRWKSVRCPRRAGKTHGAIAYAIYCALTNPGCSIPIIALTLKSAKRLYWDPFKAFDAQYGLKLEHRIAEQTFVFPNGSKIFLNGAEKFSEIDKLRGGAYKLVLIDECASFDRRLFMELLDEVVTPATNDVDGSIVILGTPGKILAGPFYEATIDGFRNHKGHLVGRDFYKPELFWKDPPQVASPDGGTVPLIPMWSRHYWTSKHNTYKPQIWKNAVQVKISRGWSDDNPIWLRESLGQWVAMSDAYVYSLNTLVTIDGGLDRCRCIWQKPAPGTRDTNKWGLPLNSRAEDDWRFVLGMDQGFEDDFAMVVVAYSPTNQVLHQVYDFKAKHMVVAEIVAKLRYVVDLFDDRIDQMISDTGPMKALVESINRQYGFAIERAEKNNKFDYIELLNSDLHAGVFKAMAGGGLVEEWRDLQWDFRGVDRERAVRTGKMLEDSRCPNHISDACLYTWRFCYHYLGRDLAPEVDPDSPQAWGAFERAEMARLESEYHDKQHYSGLADWGIEEDDFLEEPF